MGASMEDSWLTEHSSLLPQILSVIGSLRLISGLEDRVKTLTEKLSLAELEITTKDNRIKQHAKVAEEAVSGKPTNINENDQCLDDEDGIDNVLEVDHEAVYSRDDFEDPETDDEIDVVDVPRNTSFANDIIGNEDYSEVLRRRRAGRVRRQVVQLVKCIEA